MFNSLTGNFSFSHASNYPLCGMKSSRRGTWMSDKLGGNFIAFALS